MCDLVGIQTPHHMPHAPTSTIQPHIIFEIILKNKISRLKCS
jgi:hypothetical protein